MELCIGRSSRLSCVMLLTTRRDANSADNLGRREVKRGAISRTLRHENANPHSLRCLKFESNLTVRRPSLEQAPIATGTGYVEGGGRWLAPCQPLVVLDGRFPSGHGTRIAVLAEPTIFAMAVVPVPAFAPKKARWAPGTRPNGCCGATFVAMGQQFSKI
jgi:hypothetical protein